MLIKTSVPRHFPVVLVVCLWTIISQGQSPFPCVTGSCLTVVPQQGGWIVGEIRTVAFGADSARLLSQLAAQGWVECAGQSLIRKDFDGLWRAIGTEWGAADKTNVFYLPDLRGMFLRGWNDHRTAPPQYKVPPYAGDTDIDSRLAPRPEAGDSNGVAGPVSSSGKLDKDHVGTVQAHEVGPHQHDYVSKGKTYQVASDNHAPQVFWGDTSTQQTPPLAGAVETHPNNASVMYIIYVGHPAIVVAPTREEANRGITGKVVRKPATKRIGTQ